MKQIVRFEVFLSNSVEPVFAVEPTHIFEGLFECLDDSGREKMDEDVFDFEWKIRSFVLSCHDVFKYVSVSKVVKIVDYGF